MFRTINKQGEIQYSTRLTSRIQRTQHRHTESAVYRLITATSPKVGARSYHQLPVGARSYHQINKQGEIQYSTRLTSRIQRTQHRHTESAVYRLITATSPKVGARSYHQLPVGARSYHQINKQGEIQYSTRLTSRIQRTQHRHTESAVYRLITATSPKVGARSYHQIKWPFLTNGCKNMGKASVCSNTGHVLLYILLK